MRKLRYLLGLIICALCITYPIQGYATEATEEQALDITAEAAEELVLDTSDSQGTVILYGANSETFERDKYVNDKAYNEYVDAFNNLDESYQSYTFEYGSSATYKVSGYSVDVSEDGVVTPHFVVYYYKKSGTGWISYGPNPDGGYDFTRDICNTGDSTVTVTIGDTSIDYHFSVKDFAEKYREDKINYFLNTYITDDMTDYQKYEAAVIFVSHNYDYSYTYYTYENEALYGGGNCWGNSYYVQELCNRLGIKTRIRYGFYDGGDGHRNVAALIDDKIYVAEAGNTGSAPRKYSIVNEGDGYYATKFITIAGNKSYGTLVQYDGWDTDLIVPEKANGYTITAIDSSTFSRYADMQYTSIVLPDTLTYLRDASLSNIPLLKEINIPRNVDKIGVNVFNYDTSLERITVDEANPYFCSDGIALYDKAKTKLIAYPYNGAKDYTVADTVTTVAEYAFSNNSITEKLTLPLGVTTVEQYAFYNCKLKEMVFTGDRPTFGKNAFSMCSAVIYYPASNTTWAGIENENFGNNVKIRFVPYGASTELNSCKVTGNSLALNGQIGLNFFLKLVDGASVIRINGCNGTTDINVSDLTPVNDNTDYNGDYMVTYAVPAKNMADNITVTVLDSTGNALKLANGDGTSTSYSRSVQDYLDDAKTKGGKLATLANSLETYGNYAHAYLTGDTSQISNNIPAVSFDSYEPYFADTRLPAGVNYLGMSLLLEDTVGFRYYFSGDISNERIATTPNYLAMKVVKISDNLSYIELSGLPAAKYDTLVSVQVKNWTLINNVFTYGCLADKGNNQALKQLCYAMYDVHIKAKDYFAK